MKGLSQPLPVFLMQLVIIIVASRLCAYLFKKIGQPAVMGEIVAGIALGPSLLGSISPEFNAFVFPATSLGNLQMLSQVGLILFMFVIGMELDLNIIRKKAGSAVLISSTSTVIPFILGVALAYYLYGSYAPPSISFYGFALFMGIAMSITAFPVLARIIKERQLTQTRLGTVALTSAAINDVTGWCLLAFVIAIARAETMSNAFYTLAAATVYVAVMLLAVRPLLKKLAEEHNNAFIKQSSLAIIFLILLLSSYCCEIIGIHALFGAFMAGIIMPLEWNFRNIIINKVEDVASIMFLPIFFALTGLRTQMGLLNDTSLWATCGLIILLAIAGKFGGSALAARMTRETTHESLAIGALMNTRGLMELIILNIGYDLGILSPQIFTMMVLMALVTTFMTSPVLNVLDRIYKRSAETRK